MSEVLDQICELIRQGGDARGAVRFYESLKKTTQYEKEESLKRLVDIFMNNNDGGKDV